MSAISSAEMRLLLSGAAQLGRRWKTVSAPTLADVGHLVGRDAAVVERRGPVGTPLENGERPHLVGDLGDDLDCRGAGADHRHLLAGKLDTVVRPVKRMEGMALEAVHALEARQRRDRQQAERQDNEAGAERAAVGEAEPPGVGGLVVMSRVDTGVELHVAAQVELLGDMVQVAQVLGLAGEFFLPVPFVQELARERVAVGVALRVEAATRVTIRVPGAAEVGCRFQHGRLHAKVDQPLDLVDAGHAGADHDDLVVEHGLLPICCLAHVNAAARLAQRDWTCPFRSAAQDAPSAVRPCTAARYPAARR
jgi:hypothetical protein